MYANALMSSVDFPDAFVEDKKDDFTPQENGIQFHTCPFLVSLLPFISDLCQVSCLLSSRSKVLTSPTLIWASLSLPLCEEQFSISTSQPSLHSQLLIKQEGIKNNNKNSLLLLGLPNLARKNTSSVAWDTH